MRKVWRLKGQDWVDPLLWFLVRVVDSKGESSGWSRRSPLHSEQREEKQGPTVLLGEAHPSGLRTFCQVPLRGAQHLPRLPPWGPSL